MPDRNRRSFLRNSSGWLVALALAIVTLISNYSANATRLEVHEQRIEKIEQSAVPRTELADVKERLQRIENKLDRLSEQRAEGRR